MRPPRMPAAAILPNPCPGDCGSKRTPVISQTPDARRGAAPETWRKTMTAVAAGAAERVAHSHRNSTPLTPHSRGISVGEANPFAIRACSTMSAIEKADAAISIVGSAVKLSEVRKSASLVALAPTRSAVIAAAQSIAIVIDRGLGVIARYALS